MITYFPTPPVCKPPYVAAMDWKGANGAMTLMLPRVVCSLWGMNEGGVPIPYHFFQEFNLERRARRLRKSSPSSSHSDLCCCFWDEIHCVAEATR